LDRTVPPAARHTPRSALSGVVANAREAITEAFDAPLAVAAHVQVVLHLNTAVSAAL
jgi:hypothetical protein